MPSPVVVFGTLRVIQTQQAYIGSGEKVFYSATNHWAEVGKTIWRHSEVVFALLMSVFIFIVLDIVFLMSTTYKCI